MLPTVLDGLLEDAIFIAQPVAHARQREGRHRVQEAGGQPPEAAVAQRGVGLAAELALRLAESRQDGLPLRRAGVPVELADRRGRRRLVGLVIPGKVPNLIDGRAVTGVLNLPREADLDSSIQPRGYRLLAKIPRLPESIAGVVAEHPGLRMATIEGSLTTMPLPRAYTSVFAVPRSMARSLENMLNSDRMLWKRVVGWKPFCDILRLSEPVIVCRRSETFSRRLA